MVFSKLEIENQVNRYFSTLHLHPSGHKGGVFTHMEKNHFKNQKSFGYQKSIENITQLLQKQQNPVFVTLNSYKKDRPTYRYCPRDDQHLWGIDTLMIDIDAPAQLCGVEDELISILEWAWNLKKIPKPNLYSYTGSGGIHLYYCIERLPKSMNESVNALKWAIAEMIIAYEKDFPEREGYTYHVDTKIFDNQRLDRVPGSIHETTGRMCICFTTDQPKYQYKELLSYCDEDKWTSKAKIEDARRYIDKIRGIKNQPTNLPTAPIDNSNRSHYVNFKNEKALCTKRINALITLAKNGKDFTNRREIACFILRNLCNQVEYTEEKTIKLLKLFNGYLSEPLSEKELLRNTKTKKTYKFTNTYLKNILNLTDDEFSIFTKKYRPGNRKERTLIDKINIAKLLLKGLPSEQICKELSISLSLLKRRRSEMKKQEGLEFWANFVIPENKQKKTFFAIIKEITENKKNYHFRLKEFLKTSWNTVALQLLQDILCCFKENDMNSWLTNSS